MKKTLETIVSIRITAPILAGIAPSGTADLFLKAIFVESLKAIVIWFFALDHQNYARCISMHIHDPQSLPSSVHWEFRKLSSMPIDQTHEQNNELVKGSGWAVGLTENPSVFRKWMIARPEQARFLKEFEQEFISNVATAS